MTDEPRYLVTLIPDGLDVLHRNPGDSCELDADYGCQSIDPDTADALQSMGEARQCQHCWPEGA